MDHNIANFFEGELGGQLLSLEQVILGDVKITVGALRRLLRLPSLLVVG
jgi:hypothetical protein